MGLIDKEKNEYRCDECGKTFISKWSHEDAEKECIKNFGKVPKGQAIVCDDCYNKIMEIKCN